MLERVSIPLDRILAIWTCRCASSAASSRNSSSSSSSAAAAAKKPIYCACTNRDGDATTATITKNFDIDLRRSSVSSSLSSSSFRIKLFHAQPSERDGLRLEMLTLSAHGDAANRAGIDARAASDKFLLDLAYRIKDIIDIFDRPKRLLLFINPIGGAKRAGKIYQEKIKPLLAVANVAHDAITTGRADEAREMILDPGTDLSAYDGIVCIGGDGMFGELLNGALIRAQRDNSIAYERIDAPLVKPPITLGIIPAGSTDAIVYATSNEGRAAPINSALAILLGRTIQIDVAAVHHRDQDRLVRYTAAFLGYGFFGDTLLDAERRRSLGQCRFVWAGMRKFFDHRLYSGEIKMCIEQRDGSPKDYDPCSANCNRCQRAVKKSRQVLSAEESPACISIRGRFLAINAATISGRCGKSKQGMSPMAHVGNGCTDLILVYKCSRLQYLRYLFRVAFSNKSPFDFNFVDTYRVREFEFNPIIEPLKRKGYAFEKEIDYDFFDAVDEAAIEAASTSATTTNTSATASFSNIGDVDGGLQSTSSSSSSSSSSNNNNNHNNHNDTRRRVIRSRLGASVWNCDGEVIEETAIHVKMHCQLVTIFATGFDVERMLTKNDRPTKVRFQ